jgi:hypothetical protein
MLSELMKFTDGDKLKTAVASLIPEVSAAAPAPRVGAVAPPAVHPPVMTRAGRVTTDG